jgi:hypothetical protein
MCAHVQGPSQFEKDVFNKQQRDALIYGQQQAVMESRMAAMAIKNKMRMGENVINWGGQQ